MDNKNTIAETLAFTDEQVKLIFSSKAAKKMIFLVTCCPIEVGWHGFVKKNQVGEYFVDDIILYPQRTSAATIVCDDAQYGLWQQELCLKDPDLFETMRLHGHSHVNMRCFPSGVDKDLQDDGIEMLQENGFYIYIIINKRMEHYVKIADREDGAIYENVLVEILDDDIADLFDSYKELVRERGYGYQ